MMRKLLILVLLGVLLLGCTQQPTQPAGKKEVVIGVIGPMALPEGSSEKNAAMLAVEEINAKGGILGAKLKLVVGDTKINPDTAASEFRRLATVEKADMITGGFSSGVMNAMMEVMAETKTVFLADASSPGHPAMVEKEYDKYKYWFRISQNNGTTFAWDMVEMIDFLEESGYSVDRVYIIRDEHIWTDAVMAALKPEFEKRGIEIVADREVGRGYTDYEPLLLEAKDLNADLVMPILAIAGTGDALAKAWGTLKIPALLAGHDLAAIDYQFYDKTNGMANYEIFLNDGGALVTACPTDMCKKFVEAYKAKYGHYPESHQAYGAYDAVYAYKIAVEEAQKAGEKNPFDPDVVVKYLEKHDTKNPIVLTRTIAWHKNHALVWGDKFVRNWIAQWQDGKQYIISPKNVANGELKLPPWVTK
jgi:branched-chain amino acid transport system substrate-binding protein